MFCFIYFITVVVLLTANRCAPVPEVPHAVPDSYLAVQGSTVYYTCLEGFTPLISSPQFTVCDGVKWTPTELPGCDSKHKTSDHILLRRVYIIFRSRLNSEFMHFIHKFANNVTVAITYLNLN